MTHYPGHDTEFFIVLNGVTTGPLTGLVEVYNYNIAPDTPVWYEGLEDWKPAILAPLTRQIFIPGSEFHIAINMPDLPDDEQQSSLPECPEPPVLSQTPPEIPQAKQTEPEPPEIPVAETHTTVSDESRAEVYAPPVPQGTAKAPRTYLAPAIITTVLCNLVAGVIAIIYSIKVRSKLAAGNTAAAERCSESAQWWIAVSICLGLIGVVFNLFVGDIF